MKRVAPWIVLAGFFSLVAYMLGPNLFESHPRHASWYALHIAGGTLVLTLAPLQFVAAIRKRFRRYHRVAGYLFVTGTGLAVVGYVGLPKEDLFEASQVLALTLWAVCAAVAVFAVRAGNVLLHRHNMARSFALACYFLTARLVDRYCLWLLAPFASAKDLQMAHSDWLAWLVPLVGVEIYFAVQWQRALRASRRMAAPDSVGRGGQ